MITAVFVLLALGAVVPTAGFIVDAANDFRLFDRIFVPCMVSSAVLIVAGFVLAVVSLAVSGG